ncbi:MAG: hypothetical protein V7746_02825 [Halioglobus sp.]
MTRALANTDEAASRVYSRLLELLRARVAKPELEPKLKSVSEIEKGLNNIVEHFAWRKKTLFSRGDNVDIAAIFYMAKWAHVLSEDAEVAEIDALYQSILELSAKGEVRIKKSGLVYSETERSLMEGIDYFIRAAQAKKHFLVDGQVWNLKG